MLFTKQAVPDILNRLHPRVDHITTAQQAMAVLARCGWLDRRPRAGTFVGTAASSNLVTDCIHFN